MQEVAITGIGVISPLGMDPQAVADSLLRKRSGIGALDLPGLGRPFPVAAVPGDFEEPFTKMERPFLDRIARMSVLAARQASEQAGFANYSTFSERAGVFFGTGRGGVMTEWEASRVFYEDVSRQAKPYVLMASMANAATSQISIRQQIFGPTATHTSACSSSGSAIIDACRYIQAGQLDVALAGGGEATLADIFLRQWEGLRAVAEVAEDPATSCRPFAKERTGLVLGEGSVFFVLESVEHARSRGAEILAFVSGYGIASDAHHIGAPHARGQVAAMRAALRSGGLTPADLDYINAHATGTRGGDPVEVAAIREVIGEEAARIPVSSTKALHGHLLGAASAMEMLVCVLAARGRFVPATAHLSEVSPDCQGVVHVQETLRDRSIRYAMSMSAGFGGTNVALIVRSGDIG